MPATGAAPEAAHPAPHPAPAAPEAPAAAEGARAPAGGPSLLGSFFKKSWDTIKGIGGFFGRRIKGVASGAWEMTGGQVTGELSEGAKRLGYENKETGFLHAIAGVIEDVNKKVASVVGGVVDFTISAPLRAAGRILRGTQNIVTGAILGKTYGGSSSSAPASGGAEIPHNAAPAH